MSVLLKYPPFYCLLGAALAFVPFVRHSGWGILVLGGLIALYAVYSRWTSAQDNAAERIEVADNCYFIGFVYTLSIIAIALFLDLGKSFSAADDAGKLSPADIKKFLQTIGIALGTSVIGMFARFWLSHGVKISEDEFDREVSRAAQATHRLEATVNDAGVSLVRTAAKMQEFQNALSDYVDIVVKESETAGGRLNSVAEDAVKEFSVQVKDFLRQKQFDDVCQRMSEAAEKYRVAVEGMAGNIESSSQGFAESGKAAVADMQAAHQTLLTLQTSLADMPEQVADSVKETMRALQKGMADNFSDIHRAIDEAMSALKKAAESGQWSALGEAAKDFSAQLELVSGGLQKIAAQQAQVLSVASADMEKLRLMRDNFAALLADMNKDAQTAAGIKEEYRKRFDEAATTALDETHRLYGRLIAGAEIALSQMENLKTLAASMERIARHLEKSEK